MTGLFCVRPMSAASSKSNWITRKCFNGFGEMLLYQYYIFISTTISSKLPIIKSKYQKYSRLGLLGQDYFVLNMKKVFDDVIKRIPIEVILLNISGRGLIVANFQNWSDPFSTNQLDIRSWVKINGIHTW